MTNIIIYLVFAFIFFLWMRHYDVFYIRSLGDFARVIIAVLAWPVILIWAIISDIKDKIHKQPK